MKFLKINFHVRLKQFFRLFQLNVSQFGSNSVLYFGLFDGWDPDPAQQPGYIIMSSFLVFYK